MRRIVLTTVGTLGDLHPFVAIGLALARRGWTPVLAVPEDQVWKCRQAGLEAVAVMPGFETTRRRMKLSREEAARRIIANQRVMLEQVLLPGLADGVTALDEAAAGAEAVVASIFAFAGPIVAEKRDLPIVSVILQPMAMLSAYDPPHTPDFWMMRGAPVGPIGRAWNRLAYGVLRRVLDGLYGRQIDKVRTAHGLPPKGARHLLDASERSVLRLGCYSQALGALPPDVAPDTRIVGFPIFDSGRNAGDGGEEALHPALAAFLDAGPAPLVFTLGTLAVNSAGDFYDNAARVSRQLGLRAVLLVGGDAAPTIAGDVLRCGYAPHSLLFARAAAIVHHGGVGTTGQALRAGKPQLVVPQMGDQNDHAHRIARMGVGLTVKAHLFTLSRGRKLIGALLGEPRFADAAGTVAARMAHEHGADAAADAIVAAIGPVQRR